jgi:hypothetical protein
VGLVGWSCEVSSWSVGLMGGEGTVGWLMGGSHGENRTGWRLGLVVRSGWWSAVMVGE